MMSIRYFLFMISNNSKKVFVYLKRIITFVLCLRRKKIYKIQEMLNNANIDKKTPNNLDMSDILLNTQVFSLKYFSKNVRNRM